MRSCLNTNFLGGHYLVVPVVLVAVVLAVYYPAVFSGLHPIDDPWLVDKYSSSQSLATILLPGTGYYYRPLFELSFYLDNLLWGMSPGVMHLENILLHCANTLLVFFLARKVVQQGDSESSLIPLLTTLLFALHPVNVEPVAWISGRTDPLLALFVLSATYSWLHWLEQAVWQYLAISVLLFVAAILTKETAFFFGPVLFLFACCWPGAASRSQRLRVSASMVILVFLLLIIVMKYKGEVSGLSRVIEIADFQIVQGAWNVLIAAGFYSKKLFAPFPLNFAINDVHQLYGLLGLGIPTLLWLRYRRDWLSGVFIISALLFILPATLITITHIAWTPFAERYLYLPSAFFAIGLTVVTNELKRKQQRLLMVVAATVLSVFALGTFQRIILWKDPISFFEDAVNKSPVFGSVYYSLGGELFKRGKIEPAAQAFATADRLNTRSSIRYPIKASIMGVMLAQGKLMEAHTFFYQTFKQKRDATTDFLELLLKADTKHLELLTGDEKTYLVHDMLETLQLLHNKKPDPFWLYRSGQLLLTIGDQSQAADYFHQSLISAPADAHYRGAASIYLQKLEHSR